MANVVKSQVRLVLCPKCRKVLEEPTEEIVYKCGGCDTVLQGNHKSLSIFLFQLVLIESLY